MYIHQGDLILFEHRDGTTDIRASCNTADKAAAMLNRAGDLNNRQRKYTAAARMIAQAECLPNFKWADLP